jgi:hypothetical protein
MDPRLDMNNPNSFAMPPQHSHVQHPHPQMMNAPPQLFGGYSADGLPMSMPDLSQAQLYGDGSLMDTSEEAKRRRIARVSCANAILNPEGLSKGGKR